ncbi:unnamed protein product [Ixodes pacificus]
MKKRRTAATAVANLAHSSTSSPNVPQATPPTATMDAPASLAPAATPLLNEPEGTDKNNEPRQLQELSPRTNNLSILFTQSEGVLMIACTLFAGACEASTQVAFIASELPATADASVTALCLEDHQPRVFYGYQSLVDKENDDALRDLAGETITVFLALLSVLPRVRGERYLELAVDSKLLLFLMKMKHGLTFSALGVLFYIHRSSASRIFFATLDFLYVSTRA